MKSYKKQKMFKAQVQTAIQQIQDNCRRNEQPDIYKTSYKPLLFQASYNNRKKNKPYLNLNSSQSCQRSKSHTLKNYMNMTTNYSISTRRAQTTRPKSVNTLTSVSLGRNLGKDKSRYTPYMYDHLTITKQRKGTTPSQNTTYFISQPMQLQKSGICIDNKIIFLKKLYHAKTKDLSIQPNAKQQKIFITRLQSSITDTQFNAAECDFGSNSIQSIIKYLNSNSNTNTNTNINKIIKLILDKNPIGDEGVIKISQILKTLEQLKQLSLVSVNMSSKGGSRLMKQIIGHPCLQILNISSPQGLNRNRINSQGFISIRQVLLHPMCKLHTLNLANTCMGQKGFILFCSSFSIYSYSYSQNNAPNSPKTPLTTTPSPTNHLHFKYINLSNNQISISQQNIQYFRHTLSQISVQRLQLQNNQLSDVGCKILSYVLGVQYGRSKISLYLIYLDISNNNIKSYGYQSFCTMLPTNKKITQIRINNNNLTQNQVFYCVKNLLSNSWSIQKLQLKYTLYSSQQMASFDIKSLSQGLYTNRSLKQLDISYNIIGINGFIDLFDHLQNNKILKILKLQSCGIGDLYLQKAYNYIKNNKSLCVLNLCNNFITDKGTRILIKILSQVHHLYDVNVKKNCISMHLLNDIAYQLKENKIMSSTGEDSEYLYIQYVNNMQEEQKKNILASMEELKIKEKKIFARDLAMQVVSKQDLITNKKVQIGNQNGKIIKLEQELQAMLKEKSARRRTSRASRTSDNGNGNQSNPTLNRRESQVKRQDNFQVIDGSNFLPTT